MTNEQLALLLKQITWRIRQLGKDIEPFITDGARENVKVWIGEGEPPLIQMPFAKNWEMRPEGHFTAVQMIEDFAIDLEIEAESLVPNQPVNNSLAFIEVNTWLCHHWRYYKCKATIDEIDPEIWCRWLSAGRVEFDHRAHIAINHAG